MTDAFTDLVRFAWEHLPRGGPSDPVRSMLADLGSSLRYVCLPGGGPDASADGNERVARLVTVLTVLTADDLPPPRRPGKVLCADSSVLDAARKSEHAPACGGTPSYSPNSTTSARTQTVGRV